MSLNREPRIFPRDHVQLTWAEYCDLNERIGAAEAVLGEFARDVAEHAIDDPALGSSAKMIPRGIWDRAKKLQERYAK